MEDCGADHVVTAVKDNRETMLDDLRAIDWSAARHADGGWEKGHGSAQRRLRWNTERNGTSRSW